jgi:hypothetical protein
MYEAQISLIICGTNHSHWTTYCFVDRDLDGVEFEEKFSSYEGLTEDPIANGKLDGNIPIWDPRVYFLMIFKERIIQIFTEWENLTRKVERSIQNQIQQPTLSRGFSKNEKPVEDVKETLDWTREVIELLSKLRRRLSSLINAWKSFSSPNGDICYLVDKDLLEVVQARLSLRAIQERFECMQALEQNLLSLESQCQALAQSVSTLFRPHF